MTTLAENFFKAGRRDRCSVLQFSRAASVTCIAAGGGRPVFADVQLPPAPPNGRPFNPHHHAQRLVAALAHEGWRSREFHLGAEPGGARDRARHEGQPVGYNGQSPGPTIEAVEGDRIRIFVTNKPARAHERALARRCRCRGRAWTGQRAHAAGDGVGKTFVYEFALQGAPALSWYTRMRTR